jgi:hypothetical protein
MYTRRTCRGSSTAIREATTAHLTPISVLVAAQVWDLESGVVRQTLEKAHSSSDIAPAIMSMLVWEGHLISGSLDGRIKVSLMGVEGAPQ